MNRHDIEQLFHDEQRLERLEGCVVTTIAIWLVIGTALMVVAVMIAYGILSP